MNTPFKVIDLHTHILPENWPDLKERYGYGGWVKKEIKGMLSHKSLHAGW